MSKQRQSEAYADIQPAVFGKQKKPYTPPTVIKKPEAKKLFAEMHSAVDICDRCKSKMVDGICQNYGCEGAFK